MRVEPSEPLAGNEVCRVIGFAGADEVVASGGHLFFRCDRNCRQASGFVPEEIACGYLEIARSGCGLTKLGTNGGVRNGLDQQAKPVRDSKLERERNRDLIPFAGMLEFVTGAHFELSRTQRPRGFSFENLG